MPEVTFTETQRETLKSIRSDLEAAYIDTYGHIRTTDVVQYLLDTYTPPEEQTEDVDYDRIATAEFQKLQAVAADVDEVPGSGIDAETMRGELLSTLGVEEFAARLADLDEDTESEPEGTEAAAGDAEANAEDTEVAEGDAEAEAESVETEAEDPDAADAGAAADGDDASTDDESTAPPDSSDMGSPWDADSPSETDEEGGAEASDDAESSADADESDDSDEGGADDGESTSSPVGPGAGGDSVLSVANRLLKEHNSKWREGSGESPYEVDLPDGTTESVRTKDDVRQLLFKHY